MLLKQSSHCNKQQITASWVSLKDTAVKFLGILLKIATVAEILCSKIINCTFFLKLKLRAVHIFPCQLFIFLILKSISI